MAQEETNHSFAQGYEPGDAWDYEPTLEEIERVLKHISVDGETFNPPEVSTGGLSVTNASYVEAGIETDQEIATGTFTKLELVDRADHADDFNATNHKFVAPANGMYTVTCSVSYSGTISTGVRVMSQIRVNGAEIRRSQQHTSGAGQISAPVLAITPLTAGDEVELYTWHDSDGPVDVAQSISRTFLNINMERLL